MGKKVTTKEFIEKAKNIHGNKYDYSKVNYTNNHTKVCIICSEHGEFWQVPASHLKGCGCFKCGVENSAKGHLSNKDKFIEKAKKIFGATYDYSKTLYKKSSEKVLVKCNKCGNKFLITPNNHLKGQGCPICAKEKKGAHKKETKNFIEEASFIHNDKYDYSSVVYISSKEKVCIICPEHGEFWQTPSNHLQGQGCPICNSSKLEKNALLLLEENKIKNIRQYKIGKQYLDFFLPEYNVAIECQGRQHVYPIYFGGDRFETLENQFTHMQELDKLKKETCDKLGIKILYYISKDILDEDLFKNNIYNQTNSFWNVNKLIETIKNVNHR